jgi:hypothetical protein
MQKQCEGQWQATKRWNTTKPSEPPQGVSNKQQSTLQLILALWREAATECGSGPSKSSTIVDILDVAEVAENGTVGSFAKSVGRAKWKKVLVYVEHGTRFKVLQDNDEQKVKKDPSSRRTWYTFHVKVLENNDE